MVSDATKMYFVELTKESITQIYGVLRKYKYDRCSAPDAEGSLNAMPF